MKLLRVFLTAVFALIVTASVHAQSANLLTNGDFESAIAAPNLIPNNNFSAFSQGSADPDVSNLFANDGTQSLNIVIDNADGTFAGVQQSGGPVNVGDQVLFSVDALADGDVGSAVEFRVEFRDAAGGTIDLNGDGNLDFMDDQFFNNDISSSLTSSFQTFTDTVTVPTGAAEVRAVLAAQTFGPGVTDSNSVSVFFDSASLVNLSTVPEPSSVGLIVLGLAGLVTRRRRS